MKLRLPLVLVRLMILLLSLLSFAVTMRDGRLAHASAPMVACITKATPAMCLGML